MNQNPTNPNQHQDQSKAQAPRQKSLSERIKVRAICILAFIIFRTLMATYRIVRVGNENREAAARFHPNGSFVFGLWHEHFFSAVATHPHQGISPMISQSNDGEFISYIATKLGFTPVRGSTSRGGEEAREQLYQRISRGLQGAFTADGPRGPRRKMKSGLVDLSRTGELPILPLGFSADRKWILHKSWDKSMIPKPFAKIYIVYGKPYVVPRNSHGAAFAEAKRVAEKAITDVVLEAEALAQR